MEKKTTHKRQKHLKNKTIEQRKEYTVPSNQAWWSVKYKPEFCDKLIDWMSKGYSYSAFAGEIDVCRETINNWETQHPEWKKAKKTAFAKCLKWWESAGMSGMTGNIKGFNASVWIFSMKNRFKEDYADIISIEDPSKNRPTKLSAIERKKQQLAKAYALEQESKS